MTGLDRPPTTNARPGLPRAARLVYYLSVRRPYTAGFGRLSAPASSSDR
jgi:hypothetical protein